MSEKRSERLWWLQRRTWLPLDWAGAGTRRSPGEEGGGELRIQLCFEEVEQWSGAAGAHYSLLPFGRVKQAFERPERESEKYPPVLSKGNVRPGCGLVQGGYTFSHHLIFQKERKVFLLSDKCFLVVRGRVFKGPAGIIRGWRRLVTPHLLPEEGTAAASTAGGTARVCSGSARRLGSQLQRFGLNNCCIDQ